jgi:hypothetical protein
LQIIGKDFLTLFILAASGDNGGEAFEHIKSIKQAVFVDTFLEICTKGEIGGRVHRGEVYEKKGTMKEGEEGEEEESIFSCAERNFGGRLSFNYLASFTV